MADERPQAGPERADTVAGNRMQPGAALRANSPIGHADAAVRDAPCGRARALRRLDATVAGRLAHVDPRADSATPEAVG
jgi:hypothetical protein